MAWRAAAVIVIRIVSETQLSGQRSVAHYTLYSTLLTILGQCWEDGRILPSLAASAMIISAKCPACAGEREARNVIKFYSRIIFIQIRVQSLMLALHCPGAAIRQTYFHSNDQKHSYLLILI